MTSKPAGSPVWIELLSTDPDSSAPFYEAAIGVEVTEPKKEFGGYRDVLRNGKVVAGLIREKEKSRSAWRLWLRSDDVDATLAAVPEHGGEVLEGPDDVEGLGRRAVIRDPSGAETGVWQLHGFPGIEVENEPGAPCWYELHTTDRFAETVDFYRAAFGWDIAVLGDTDDFRMVTFGEDDAALAGIYDASAQAPGGPSRWQVYFLVADVDATSQA
ncbi:MAG TPA: VOC family protein, partial [Naasia sp.]